MRILYLGGFELPDKNAAAQRVLSNAKLLREIGFEVSFIGVSKNMDNAPEYVDGFVSHPEPYPVGLLQWINHILRFIKIKEISAYKPDFIILYNFPAIASLRILHYCHKNGIKVVHDLTEWEQTDGFSPRDMIKRLDTQLRMRYCMRKMDGVIAISRFLYERYKDYTNTIMVPPTVDLHDQKWNRNREFKREDKVKLVFAGGAGPLKDRLDYVINAMQNYTNVELRVIGTSKKQYKERFGIEVPNCPNIIFIGNLSHKETIKFICDSDFQVIIRNNIKKTKAGFPTKFVESISGCTPVIATLSSNIGDYLENGVNGFVVDNNNTIEDVLDRIIKMPTEELVKMKIACRDFEKFDYHYYRNEFEKIFK